MVCFGVFGFYIIPNWLIKVPGHFGILFGWFRELRKFCQNLVPETSGLSPKCFKKYKKKYGIILERYYFCQSGTSKNENVRYLYVIGTIFCFRSFCVFLGLFWFLRFFMLFLNIYLENIFTKMRNWKWYIFHY